MAVYVGYVVDRGQGSYGLDGPGIQSRWESRFSELVQAGRQALGPTQTPIQLTPGVFPGGKVVGAWR